MNHIPVIDFRLFSDQVNEKEKNETIQEKNLFSCQWDEHFGILKLPRAKFGCKCDSATAKQTRCDIH